MFNDPVSDLLTRIRNAQSARKTEVVLPHSKLKQQVAEILADSGFIGSVNVSEHEGFKTLKIELKPDPETITSIERVSKPGRRVYAKAADIPMVLGGRGLVIVSTSGGVMTGRQAYKLGLGGELICRVW